MQTKLMKLTNSKLRPNNSAEKVILKETTMSQHKCPACESPYGYAMNDKLVCPDCAFEWEFNPNEGQLIVKDSNGNILTDGDTVIVIKDLSVKGAPKPVKAGTTVKKIRLVEGDHNIDCKIDGFGPMALKSEFVKKG